MAVYYEPSLQLKLWLSKAISILQADPNNTFTRFAGNLDMFFEALNHTNKNWSR